MLDTFSVETLTGCMWCAAPWNKSGGPRGPQLGCLVYRDHLVYFCFPFHSQMCPVVDHTLCGHSNHDPQAGDLEQVFSRCPLCGDCSSPPAQHLPCMNWPLPAWVPQSTFRPVPSTAVPCAPRVCASLPCGVVPSVGIRNEPYLINFEPPAPPQCLTYGGLVYKWVNEWIARINK